MDSSWPGNGEMYWVKKAKGTRGPVLTEVRETELCEREGWSTSLREKVMHSHIHSVHSGYRGLQNGYWSVPPKLHIAIMTVQLQFHLLIIHYLAA